MSFEKPNFFAELEAIEAQEKLAMLKQIEDEFDAMFDPEVEEFEVIETVGNAPIYVEDLFSDKMQADMYNLNAGSPYDY
jgi:hypothetical protein